MTLLDVIETYAPEWVKKMWDKKELYETEDFLDGFKSELDTEVEIDSDGFVYAYRSEGPDDVLRETPLVRLINPETGFPQSSIDSDPDL